MCAKLKVILEGREGWGENWSLRILEELELKLECADARAASLG